MDYLPKDPAILVSSVNMLLRDEEFDTLESLCYNFGTEPKEIKNYLYGHGFVYSEKQKKDDIEIAISDYANDMSQVIGLPLRSSKNCMMPFVAAELISSAITNGFRRISPRLLRYLKRCYNDDGEF